MPKVGQKYKNTKMEEVSDKLWDTPIDDLPI